MAEKAAAEVDKLTAAQKRQLTQSKNVEERTRAVRKEFDEFAAAVSRGEKSSDDAIFTFRKLAREMDTLAKRRPIGDSIGEDLNRTAQLARRSVAEIIEGERVKEKAVKDSELAKTKAADEGLKARQKMVNELLDTVRTSAAQQEKVERNLVEFEIREEARLAAVRAQYLQDRSKAAEAEANRRGKAEERVNKAAAREQAKTDRDRQRATDAELKDRERVLQSRLGEQQELRQLRTSVEDVIARYENFNLEVERGVHNAERSRAGYKQFATEIGSLQRRFDAGSEDALHLGERVEEVRGNVERMSETMKRSRGSSDEMHNALGRLFNIDPSKLERIDQRIVDFERNLNRGRFSVAAFDNRLRGLLVVGVIAFFQQLVGVAGALAGQLISLASAAAQAAVSIAGMATAGAAQAIPVLGLLGAAWGRVGAVFKVVQQAQKANTTASYDNQQALDKQRTAAEGVTSAQQGLADAHNRVGQAQASLTKARADATRQIQDLTEAERQAALQAEAAARAHSESERTLRAAISSGDIEAQISGEFDVRSTAENVRTSNLASRRASTDAQEARKGGVAGTQGVIAATAALADAQKGVDKASVSLKDAKKQAQDASKEVSAAQRSLSELFAQLSPSERRLFVVLTAISDRYKRVFTGPGGVLSSITDAFTGAAVAVLNLLGDRRFIQTAKNLADTIAGQMSRITDVLTSPASVTFIEQMADEAKRNLPAVVDIGIHMLDIFRSIATAASPALHDFIGFLDDLSGKADDATGSDSGLIKLERFFSRGEEFTESIIKLGIATGQFFLAVVGDSADEGQKSIDQLTGKLNEATAWINDHRDDVRKFFRDAREATGFVAGALLDLAKGIFSLFHADQVKAFATTFSDVVLPAMLDVARTLGVIVSLLLELTATGPGGALVRMALTAFLLYKSIVPLITIFSRLVVLAGTLASSERLVGGGLKAVEIVSGPLGKALAVIAGTLLLLSGNFHDIGKKIADMLPLFLGLATTLIGPTGLAAGLRAVVGGLESLAAVGVAGRLGTIGTLLGGMLTKVLGLVRQLPIVNKLLKTTAEEQIVADASGITPGGVILPGTAAAKGESAAATGAVRGAGAAEAAAVSAAAGGSLGKAGAAAGKLFSGGAATTALKFLKGAGWLSVGIAAGEGILSGFRHHSVTAGFRDFFHSLSFGLVDSFDKVTSDALKRLNARLRENKPLDLTSSTTVRRPTLPGAPGVDVSTQSQDRQDFNRLTGTQKLVIKGIQRFQADFNTINNKRLGAGFIGGYITRLEEFDREAPPEFKGTLDKMLEAAKQHKRELDAVFDRKALVTSIVGGFGLALQAPHADVKKTVDGLINQIGRLPPAAQQKAADSAIGMARGLASRGKLPQKEAQKIEQSVTDAMEKMRDRATKKAARTAVDTASALTALANVVAVSMAGLVSDVNGVLRSLGFGGIKIPKTISKGDVSSGAKKIGSIVGSLGGLLGGAAGGGFLGRQGERGADGTAGVLGGKAVGRGEMFVANWAHQKYIDTALHGQFGHGIGEMFNRVRGEHAGGSGLAKGGYVQNAIPPPGGTPSLIKKLFGLGFDVTSAFRGGARTISGNESYHAAGKAWDFGDSVNNIKKLWSIVFPLRKAIAELIGPSSVSHGRSYYYGSAKNITGTALQAQHEDHIHIAIVGRVASAVSRLLENIADKADRVKAPRVPGSGALSKIAQGMLDRVAGAGNKRVAKASGGKAGGDETGLQQSGTGRTLMERISKQRGWSFDSWWKLDDLETSHGRNTVNPTSTARLRGQFLDLNYGKYGAGSDPRKHPSMRQQIIAMARYIAERYGNPSKALAFHLANNYYARGGEIPGPLGRAVPIIAHAKEWVVNPTQQGRIAQMARTSVGRVRSALGFSGGSGSFAGGGEPAVTKSGDFRLPDVVPTDPSGLIEVGRSIGVFMHRLSTNAKGFLDKFRGALRELITQDGILDQLETAITDLTTNLATQLTRATLRVTKSGNIIRALSPVQVADRELSNLERVYRRLVGERGIINQQLADISNRLTELGEGGVSKSERGLVNRLRGFRSNLNKRLDKVEGDIAANVQSRFDAIDAAIQARVDDANTVAQRGLARFDVIDQARGVIGGTILRATGAASNETLGRQRAGILGDQAAALQKAAKRARRAGHTELAADIEGQLADIRQQAVQAVVDGISADVDEINRVAARRSTGLDIRQRISTALGRTQDVAKIAADRIKSVNAQIQELQQKQARATQGGLGALAEQIGDQITDLQTTVTEIASEALSNAVDAVNDAAARKSSRLDLRDRMSDLLEKAGNSAAAFAQRGDTLVQRGQAITAQRSALNVLLGQARTQGNQGEVDKLTDQIAELDVQMSENTAAIKANTVAARQASIDSILRRGSFLTGVFGGLQGLVQAIGAISGVVDINAMKTLVQQTITTLQTTGTGLTQQLLEGFGIDLRGLSGSGLVSALGNLNFASIETGMSQDQQDQFENLINAIIENATAVQSNTQQLQQLNNPTAQSFTSTAWQWFNNAIFNGAGGLLPQYAVPGMLGTSAIGPGLNFANVGAGATAANASAAQAGGRGAFAPSITNVEKTVDMDAETLNNKLWFSYRNQPSTG